MVNTKNILIIGRIGSGKSALANLLFNKEENFESEGEFKEVFKESDSSFSETRNVLIKETKINEIMYRIVDTVGIGNINLTDEEVANEIFRTCHELNEGITQVLFVIGGRISLKEVKVYNMLRKKIFDKDEDIARYTSIVRTRFHNFRDKDQCTKDIKELKEENKRSNKKIRDLVNLCNGVVHIDNLSLSSANEKEISVYKKRKKDSRNIILEYLATCHRQDVYKPENLKSLNKIFGKQSNNESTQSSLSKEIEKLRKQNFLRKGVKKIGEKLSTNPKTEAETKESVLETIIEINNSCKQM